MNNPNIIIFFSILVLCLPLIIYPLFLLYGKKKYQKIQEIFGGNLGLSQEFKFVFNNKEISLAVSGSKYGPNFPNLRFVINSNYDLLITKKGSVVLNTLLPKFTNKVVSKTREISRMMIDYKTDNEAKANQLMAHLENKSNLGILLSEKDSYIKISKETLLTKDGLQRTRTLFYWGMTHDIFDNPQILKDYLNDLFEVVNFVESQ